jgi:serine/threonine protein phosphatase PrpC
MCGRELPATEVAPEAGVEAVPTEETTAGEEAIPAPRTEPVSVAKVDEVASAEPAVDLESEVPAGEEPIAEPEMEGPTPEEMASEAEAEEGVVEETAPGAETVEAAAEEPVPEAEELPKGPAPDVKATEPPAEEGAEPEIQDVDREEVGKPIQEVAEDAAPPKLDEPEPRMALTPGTVLAGRYVVVEALDVGENKILYSAHDLQHCGQCGFEGNDPDDAFCAQCGASLDRRPNVRLLEVQDSQAEPSGGESVAERLTMDGRAFLFLAEPEPEEPVAPPPQSIRLLVGQRSDAGLVRELDEDSLLALTLAPTYESRTGPVLGLFAVADGMGGHSGGEIASKIALQVLAEKALRSIILPELAEELVPEETLLARLRQATVAANDAVYLDRQKRENDMGTTLTALLVRDDKVFLAHVGDCRAYRWNADGLQQLTTDHSLVASLIARGQAEPEEIYTHPHRSVIYRCIGDRPVLEVDTDVLPLACGDRLVVCCDGLWEMVRDEGIEDVMMQEANPQAACDLLVKHANLAGGEDNISVIVVQVEAA